MAIRQTIYLTSGEDFALTHVHRDTSGSPVSIIGWDATMAIKSGYGAWEAQEAGLSTISDDAINGTIAITDSRIWTLTFYVDAGQHERVDAFTQAKTGLTVGGEAITLVAPPVRTGNMFRLRFEKGGDVDTILETAATSTIQDNGVTFATVANTKEQASEATVTATGQWYLQCIETNKGELKVAMTGDQTAGLVDELFFAFFEQSWRERSSRYVNFIYDLELTDPNGKVVRALEGRARVQRGVTSV